MAKLRWLIPVLISFLGLLFTAWQVLKPQPPTTAISNVAVGVVAGRVSNSESYNISVDSSGAGAKIVGVNNGNMSISDEQ